LSQGAGFGLFRLGHGGDADMPAGAFAARESSVSLEVARG